MEHYKVEELYGKAIKDKRGGDNNIHSWDIGIKGEITQEQRGLLEILLRQRRNKKWADLIGIKWMDGMPLTEEMISSFYSHENLHEMLIDLVDKGYLVYEYPKQLIGNRRVPDTTLKKGTILLLVNYHLNFQRYYHQMMYHLLLLQQTYKN